MLAFFLKGFLIGLSVAAPVGPIGFLCIQRTLSGGMRFGFVSGLGAAAADAAYGAVAGFGLSAISAFLVAQTGWARLLGGVFLLYMAGRILMTPPAEKGNGRASGGLAGAFTSVFALTLTNPTTILSFAAIFAGLGLVETGGDYGLAAVLVIGVFLGSAAWWLALSGISGALHRRVGPSFLVWVNRVSALVIGGFGIWALAGLLG